jgi:hypothetical protein
MLYKPIDNFVSRAVSHPPQKAETLILSSRSDTALPCLGLSYVDRSFFGFSTSAENRSDTLASESFTRQGSLSEHSPIMGKSQ